MDPMRAELVKLLGNLRERDAEAADLVASKIERAVIFSDAPALAVRRVCDELQSFVARLPQRRAA